MIHNIKSTILAFENANPFTKRPLDVNIGDTLILPQNKNDIESEIYREGLLEWIKCFFVLQQNNLGEYEIIKCVSFFGAEVVV